MALNDSVSETLSDVNSKTLTRVDYAREPWSGFSMTQGELREVVGAWFMAQRQRMPAVSEREFARQVGLSATEVNHFKSGERFPTWKAIAQVADYFKIRDDEMFLEWAKIAQQKRNAAALTAGPEFSLSKKISAGRVASVAHHQGASADSPRKPLPAPTETKRDSRPSRSGTRRRKRPD